MFYHRLLVLFVLFLVSLNGLARQSCDWPFRTTVDIRERSGQTLNDYQVKLEISSANLSNLYDFTATGYDLRVFDTDDNTPLEFWIENWNQVAATADVWVRFPASAPLVANSTRRIILYYGNVEAPEITNVPFTFVEPGIKFHARPSFLDPTNKTQAFNEFNSIADNGNNNDGYGCTFITNFTGITKNSQFGAGNNFAALSESYFEVAPGESGTWEFRYGADFGGGGGLYVNDVALEEDWNNDLWWANDWNNPDVLQGSINLSTGYHKLEVIGFEGCCDGGITVQFRKPGGNWTTFSTSAIDIRSRACPVTEPTVTFNSSHDVCGVVDVRLRNSFLDIPGTTWVNYTEQRVRGRFRNLGGGTGSTPTIPPTVLEFTVPAGFILNRFDDSDGSGNWSCVQSTATLVSCSYNATVSTNMNSPWVSLYLQPDLTVTPGSKGISLLLKPSQYDLNPSNNGPINKNTNVLSNSVPDSTPTCGTPDSGVFASFFDIETYSDNSIDNAAEMQALVDTRATAEFLDGQTILNRIAGDNNPFDDRGDDFYLVRLTGYLNIPQTGTYRFAVDGDDAIEFSINNFILSTFYGLHPKSNGPVDPNLIELDAGFHPFEYRMQEYQGFAAFDLYWRPPSGSQDVIIPASQFFHCAGDAKIDLSPDVSIVSDPISGTNNPKAIPGAIIDYEVEVVNSGNISTDTNTTTIVQALNTQNKLFIGDLSGTGPIDFVDGGGVRQSGLSYQFTALDSTTDSISFSNDNGATFDYVPVDDGEGYDPQVTHIRLTLSGSFKPSFDTVIPKFDFRYRMLVQ